jgi:hypothetical protein
MRSLHFDDQLDQRLRQAAEIEGASVSEFIRRAAAERADRILAMDARQRFADVIGVFRGRRLQARRSGAAFTEVVRGKRQRRL